MRVWILVAVGGALGAMARYGLGLGLTRLAGDAWPTATLVINVLGSFILGYLLRLSTQGTLDPELRLLLGVGFCGALTTFSTVSVELVGLLQAGRTLGAGLYIALSMGVGLGAAALGDLLARAPR